MAKKKKQTNHVTCNGCGNPARLVTGAELYPHRPELAHVRAWACTPCDRRVGCHDGTTNPKGRMGDATERAARQRAHAAFDPLWQNDGPMASRRLAYAWLADQLGMPVKRTHIAYFSVEECERVVELCEEWRAVGYTPEERHELADMELASRWRHGYWRTRRGDLTKVDELNEDHLSAIIDFCDKRALPKMRAAAIKTREARAAIECRSESA